MVCHVAFSTAAPTISPEVRQLRNSCRNIWSGPRHCRTRQPLPRHRWDCRDVSMVLLTNCGDVLVSSSAKRFCCNCRDVLASSSVKRFCCNCRDGLASSSVKLFCCNCRDVLASSSVKLFCCNCTSRDAALVGVSVKVAPEPRSSTAPCTACSSPSPSSALRRPALASHDASGAAPVRLCLHFIAASLVAKGRLSIL